MTTVGNVLDVLNGFAPVELQMDFDNAGFLVGNRKMAVNKILVSLDITSAVINEAKNLGAELIVSHHPVIWYSMKRVTMDDVQQSHVMELAENRISAICMHTNLDIANGGVNDVLLEKLGLKSLGFLQKVSDNNGVGRYGEYSNTMPLEKMLYLCKKELKCNGIRYVRGSGLVKRVAVMGGSGGDAILEAKKLGCDTYITADIKYDQFLLAKEIDINLFDVGHYNSENIITPVLVNYIQEMVPEVKVYLTTVHEQVDEYYI